MLAQAKTSALMLLVMSILTGLAYPLAVTGVAQLVFPYQANGSLITVDGTAVGSDLIGQPKSCSRLSCGSAQPRATGPAVLPRYDGPTP